jgi:hypothetical protein
VGQRFRQHKRVVGDKLRRLRAGGQLHRAPQRRHRGVVPAQRPLRHGQVVQDRRPRVRVDHGGVGGGFMFPGLPEQPKSTGCSCNEVPTDAVVFALTGLLALARRRRARR